MAALSSPTTSSIRLETPCEIHLNFDLHITSLTNPAVMLLVQLWVQCFACKTFTIQSNRTLCGFMSISGRGEVQVSSHASVRQVCETFLHDAGLPSRSSFSSLLASLLSRRSCFSISALIRLDSFASSLRQQAIMESKVITA